MHYDVSAERCLQLCDESSCMKAVHNPSFKVWGNDHRTNCRLWSEEATACDHQPDAGFLTMIRCDWELGKFD